jgi:outer membrane receptor protein involved in Fe transport
MGRAVVTSTPARRGQPRAATRAQVALCLGLVLFARDDVLAGEVAPTPDPPVLAEVVVTATRREAPLGQVPISIHVVRGARLGPDASVDFHDVAHAAPGLSFTDLGFSPGHDLAIRGINTSGTFNESRPLTAYYFGDTPLGYAGNGSGILTYDPQVELVDIERVEVLRGPQGTYFGANAMGGALRIVPNPPDAGARYGLVAFDLGARAHGAPDTGVRIVHNEPSAHGAWRATGWWRDGGGWIDDPARGEDDVNGRRVAGLRLAGAWPLAGTWRLDAGLVVHRQRGDGFTFDEIGEPEYVQTRRIDEWDTDDWNLATLGAHREGEGIEAHANFSWFDRASDADFDVSDFVAPVFLVDSTMTARNRNDQRDRTLELRVNSTGDDRRVHWLLGVFLQRREYRGAQDFPAPELAAARPDFDLGGGLVAVIRARSDQAQSALYGDVTWRAGGWEAAIGGRAFRFTDDSGLRAVGVLGNGATDLEGEDGGFTPRASLRYRFNSGTMAYVSASEGFRPGGANDPTGSELPACQAELAALGLGSVPASFASDSLWSYEVGLKGHWLDRRLSANVSAYAIDWRDIQTDVVLNCTGQVMVLNGNRARSTGLEVDLAARPHPRLDLELSASFNRARYVGDVPGVGAGDDLALPGTPRVAWNAAAAWRFDARNASVRLEHVFVGGSLNDPFSPAPLRIGGYHLTHVGFGWDWGRCRIEVRLRNAFDKRAVTGGMTGFLGNLEGVAPPRSLVVSIARPFG